MARNTKTTAKAFAYGLAVCASLNSLPALGQERRDNRAGEFDFYVLSLSWSPTFCADKGDGNRGQCGIEKDFRFIVHGLWPRRHG